MRAVIETANRLGAKILIVKINGIEKLLYKNGKIYIIRDGEGVIHRKLWPREIKEIKERIKRGEFYYS